MTEPGSWTPAHVSEWVERHGGNVTDLARRLAVSRKRLHSWKQEEGRDRRSLPKYVQAHMADLDELAAVTAERDQLRARLAEVEGQG